MKQPINYDADVCGKVPLHQTNSIQPHGILLVVDKNNLNILQVSENAVEIFARPVEELVASNLANHLSAENAGELKKVLTTNTAGKIPFTFDLSSGTFLSVIYQHESYLVVELEKQSRHQKEQASFLSIYQRVKLLMASLEESTTTELTCETLVKELKKLSGFDKVMVYRFDEEWNGDVIAEAKETGMEAYLGLKFPASDIPKQARELYKKTPYRLIPTTEYDPVKLFPVLNPHTNAFTDLSHSNLRSVAGVHLEYLRNMKVDASMSTRILKDGQLWGLIACHHRTPFYLSFEMCSVFELVSNLVATKIAAVQGKDLLDYNVEKQQAMADFMQVIYKRTQPQDYKHNLMSLLEADGIAIVKNNKVEIAGSTPSVREIEDLVMWLDSNETHHAYQQTSLSAVYEPADVYTQEASGLLVLPLETDKRNFVLAFRKEAVHTVSWGGNPSEVVQFESDRKKYHPRASFKLWQQTVEKTAMPWSNEVLQVAGKVQDILAEQEINH